MPQLERYSVPVFLSPDHVSRGPCSCPSWTILLFFFTLKVYSSVQRQKCQKLWMEASQGKMANCCWVGKGWGVVVGRWPCMSWHTIQGGVRIKKKVVVFPPAPLAKLAFLSVGWLDHLKCITSGQTGSPYTGFQIWHECNFKFLTSSPYAGFQIMCKCNFKVVAASLQPSCMAQNVGA